ncbi:S1 RNA-binding domain-containing protein [Streptomyces sp. NPDC003832]
MGELWAFLKARRPGEVLSGTVAAIERFGVFVALDEGPGHPVLPGAGFITVPELSWRRLDSATDVVEVGQRVSCEFLQFDDGHGEARLSLRALRPDPFRAFAESHSVGQRLRGRVTRLTPIGVFVRVADGIEGLVRPEDLDATPSTPARSAVGDDMAVVITNIDHDRRTLSLTQPRVVTGSA